MKKLIFALAAFALLLAPKTTTAQSKDIVDVAVSVDDFSTLVTALQAADLVGALKGDGPFTVFAPVNSGFAKIDSETLNSLLQPENKEHKLKNKPLVSAIANSAVRNNNLPDEGKYIGKPFQ